MKFYKKTSIIICAFLLVGCVSSRHSTALTSEQAKRIAVQLANDEASKIYHCKPFRGDEPARFEAGNWVWIDQQGFGLGDIQATVNLAADGSTHTVDLQMRHSAETKEF